MGVSEEASATRCVKVSSNNGMELTALRAAAHTDRYTHKET